MITVLMFWLVFLPTIAALGGLLSFAVVSFVENRANARKGQ